MIYKEEERIKLAVTGDSWMRRGVGSIRSLMKDFFSRAKDEVLIAAYSISQNKEFLQMMDDLLVRGIRVAVVVNRFKKQPENVQLALKKTSLKYKNFLLFDFKPKNDLEDLHSKVMVADHRCALVGSANFSTRGLFRNHEIMIQLSGRAAHEIGILIDTLIKSPNVSRIKFDNI